MIITVPTLLVDKKKCLANIKYMSEKVSRNNLIFRPHFKTHQSIQVGRWYREFGVTKITASSLRMAEYFAQDGWDDITVAFPVNILEIDRINSLSEKIALNILITSKESAARLNKNLRHKVNFFIKIDTGTHRAGIEVKNKNEIDEILNASKESDKLNFKGFLAHSGHTYKARSNDEVRQIHEQGLSILSELKDIYRKKYPEIIISIGDTPSCSLMENFEDADEIRPGNFAFYDLQQYSHGVCTIDKIAVAMACPIVAKNKERKEILIYGGGIHFSKDSFILENGTTAFGFPVKLNRGNWELPYENSYLSSLSQEHGIIKTSDKLFDKINVGDVIGVLPAHSCMTVNCMGIYYTLEGEEISAMRN
jgi:D-serine deaminase-like pyridoxal phosphate-dependent protein